MTLTALGQSRFVRVVNSFSELVSGNPLQLHTNVFVVYGTNFGDNLGGIFAYYRSSVLTTNSTSVFAPSTGIGRYIKQIPSVGGATGGGVAAAGTLFGPLTPGRIPLASTATNLTDSMLSQANTNILQIGQDVGTRLIAFADAPSGISSYELDAGGVARLVLSVGTNSTDNSIQMFNAAVAMIFKVAEDGNVSTIRSVPYVWPSANAGGVLNNDGAGNLSWGGSGSVFSGFYGGGLPTDVPTVSAALAYDLDPPGTLYLWDGTIWY